MKLEITQATSGDASVAAFVTDEQGGNMQSGKTQRHANVVVDAETLAASSRNVSRVKRRLESQDSSTVVHNQARRRYSAPKLSGEPRFRVEECR